LFQMAGLKHTLASTSAFLTQFYVLAIPVVLALWHRRWPSVWVWVSCALVIVGMGVLCNVDWRNFRLGRGEWLTLASSLFFTAQILWLDRKCFAAADKWLATLVLFVTIAVMFFPVALLTGDRPRDLMTVNASSSTFAMLVLLALVPGLAAFWLMNVWQPQIHPAHAGLVYCTEPVFTSLYALCLPELLSRWGGFTYANEQLTAHLWLGGALITVANILIQFAPRES
jgi:drug/metabolite transporter (DMT)-like permease